MAAADRNTSLPWQDFEAEVAERIRREVEFYRTSINPRLARVRRSPEYWSRDRQRPIIFDVSVEATEAGCTDPSLVWVIECKDYPSKRVDVGEVEEFAQKLLQVAPMRVKGTVFTRLGFQESALRFAESKGISLFTLGKELVRVLTFDAKSGGYDEISYPCNEGISALTGVRLGARPWTLDQIIQIELRRSGLLPELPRRF